MFANKDSSATLTYPSNPSSIAPILYGTSEFNSSTSMYELKLRVGFKFFNQEQDASLVDRQKLSMYIAGFQGGSPGAGTINLNPDVTWRLRGNMQHIKVISQAT